MLYKHITCNVVVWLSEEVVATDYDMILFKQKTAYEMRISDWSSDVCSSDLLPRTDHLVTRCQAAYGTIANGNQESLVGHARQAQYPLEIGRASCRERVCQYV